MLKVARGGGGSAGNGVYEFVQIFSAFAQTNIANARNKRPDSFRPVSGGSKTGLISIVVSMGAKLTGPFEANY